MPICIGGLRRIGKAWTSTIMLCRLLKETKDQTKNDRVGARTRLRNTCLESAQLVLEVMHGFFRRRDDQHAPRSQAFRMLLSFLIFRCRCFMSILPLWAHAVNQHSFFPSRRGHKIKASQPPSMPRPSATNRAMQCHEKILQVKVANSGVHGYLPLLNAS